ncbi:SDR family oxidoreductase [Mesobacillus selenatarsenatis]|uniref:UDP-glucose 4-epimerase n=1 Tax=Mesobacillus selenatarsenatis (strain DSM 18680 / JCM 14380 / FERM P-15431 / SF-1) TaxID=1321606 RepID=A0A0A8WZU4_MESS1|nr:SDR family oxidoreductase [Mesobacillus selenatarsenatis]GAM12489.1 UDP-glucose 4-epimerase [Mesobacillus selenatarsenatis SF-1]
MNILITGASGYLGTQLVNRLIDLNKTNGQKWNIIATDIRADSAFNKEDGIRYIQLDVRSPQVQAVIRENNIHTVVHLATIVTPGKKSNREFEYSVDVKGTDNILQACVENQVKRVVVTSSGAAYGYHADNPEWIKEDDAIRGNEEFSYSHHKRLVEELLKDYRKKHPNLEQVIFRIGTILGDTVNNQITNLFEKRVLLGISGSNSPFVFIWDQDVVGCLIKGINGKETGIFNVAGDGSLTIDEIGEILGKPVIRLPVWLVKSILFILKRLSLTQYGEEQVNFLRYRPVLDNHNLKSRFHYTPKKTSREVFLYYVEKKHYAIRRSGKGAVV